MNTIHVPRRRFPAIAAAFGMTAACLTPDRRLLLAVGEPSDGERGHGEAHGLGNEVEGKLLVLDPHRLEDGPIAQYERRIRA